MMADEINTDNPCSVCGRFIQHVSSAMQEQQVRLCHDCAPDLASLLSLLAKAKEGLTLRIGSSVVVEGTVYVVESYQRMVNRDGASINIFAVDPMVALQKELERKAKFSQMEMITGDAPAVMRQTRKLLEDEKKTPEG